MRATGIYEILNTANGKRYIGSAVCFRDRWKTHRRDLASGGHHSPHLQRAWDKYGEVGFKFNILLVCSRKELYFYEQRAMDVLHPEYNTSPVAGSRLGSKLTSAQRAAHSAMMKKRWADNPEKMRAAVAGTQWKNKTGHTEESKKKISAAKKGRPRPDGAGVKTGAALRGRPRPQEVREKIAAAQRGVPRPRPSDAVREKLRIAQTARRVREREERTGAPL